MLSSILEIKREMDMHKKIKDLVLNGRQQCFKEKIFRG